MGGAAPELIAPPSWRTIDFISDLHLADDSPRTFAAWASYMAATTADAVFILGDLFEAWPGDDARHGGFEAQCAAVLRAAPATRAVALMVGNRDFLVGAALLADCGVRPLADPTVLVAFEQRVLLSHGDELCIADTDYQRVRRVMRDPVWQAEMLAKPLALRRAIAQQMRDQSERHQGGQSPDQDVDVDRPAALQWMRAAATPTLIHGHTHRPGAEIYATGFGREVLSDWDLDHAARAEVLRWQGGVLSRLSPERASTPG